MGDTKVGILVVCRSASTRLKNKLTLEVCGKTLIEHTVDRLETAACDTLIICTTTDRSDDIFESIFSAKNVPVYRGNPRDPFRRMYNCALEYGLTHFIYAGADDVLLDPLLCSVMSSRVCHTKADMTWMSGIVCGFSPYLFSTLGSRRLIQELGDEIVTIPEKYMQDMTGFVVDNVSNSAFDYLKRPDIRATLDYAEDFEFFRQIIEALYGNGDTYTNADVMSYLVNHENTIKINQFRHVEWLRKQDSEYKPIADQKQQKVTKFIGRELEYVTAVLKSKEWSNHTGSWTRNLETVFAHRFGVKYGVAANSGTSTLHACLVAAGVKAGDEVISPALTVIMDTTATLHANAIPVYADICHDTWTIDPEDIKRKITEKTKAIIVVTLYGLPVHYDEIMQIANTHGICVIEDNAECFLSTYNGTLTGTIGHMASYSFENSKHVSCGEGGIVITNDRDKARTVRKLCGHGFRNLSADDGRVVQAAGLDVSSPKFLRHDVVGWNYRLSEFCAAVALGQVENLDRLVTRAMVEAMTCQDVSKHHRCR
jgi:dTDP-4-amino-4,6-dideoxygalactose transaminase/spore coat polysaccharide biosynthesis protein SpsF (cytidylyltransferase family)